MTTATIRRRPPQKKKEVWMEIKDPAKIRRARLQKRWTQRDLAQLTRRSQAAIQLVESGKLKNISETFAMGIAFSLGIDWEDLFIDHEHVAAPIDQSASHSTSHVENQHAARLARPANARKRTA
ncbi:UNVERIFIED_ORG: transcriptional regulator with XRE-family HTH domain [Arthrobacter sp. UYEF1]